MTYIASSRDENNIKFVFEKYENDGGPVLFIILTRTTRHPNTKQSKIDWRLSFPFYKCDYNVAGMHGTISWALLYIKGHG